ncbi:hypothetical protein E2C01_041516 [Portunus trituberculatus]|uniref:Uncharacterized protein n=1 Tax=Portunus trituberculatus TaxID=210409 RepID=A0A5B7FR53_PORTR|nr:hypothetical protein [Portunus trituberculatus]
MRRFRVTLQTSGAAAAVMQEFKHFAARRLWGEVRLRESHPDRPAPAPGGDHGGGGLQGQSQGSRREVAHGSIGL